MKSKTPFLDFYKETLITKKLPSNGLCHSLSRTHKIRVFQKMIPTWEDATELLNTGYCSVYWASGVKADHKDELYKFTPLRQTIILFCAAINGEL